MLCWYFKYSKVKANRFLLTKMGSRRCKER